MPAPRDDESKWWRGIWHGKSKKIFAVLTVNQVEQVSDWHSETNKRGTGRWDLEFRSSAPQSRNHFPGHDLDAMIHAITRRKEDSSVSEFYHCHMTVVFEINNTIPQNSTGPRLLNVWEASCWGDRPE